MSIMEDRRIKYIIKFISTLNCQLELPVGYANYWHEYWKQFHLPGHGLLMFATKLKAK